MWIKIKSSKNEKKKKILKFEKRSECMERI